MVIKQPIGVAAAQSRRATYNAIDRPQGRACAGPSALRFHRAPRVLTPLSALAMGKTGRRGLACRRVLFSVVTSSVVVPGGKKSRGKKKKKEFLAGKKTPPIVRKLTFTGSHRKCGRHLY